MDFDLGLEVTATCGVTEAVISALLTTVNPGEKVIILEPAQEFAGAVFAGAEAVFRSARSAWTNCAGCSAQVEVSCAPGGNAEAPDDLQGFSLIV